MSDNSGILGEILEQGVSTVKQAGQQIKQIPVGLAKAAGSQVRGSDKSSGQVPPVDEKAETKEFVKELYKPSDPAKNPQKAEKAQEETEEQKLAKLRQELHANYYQSLINPPKAPEEKKTEKIEREKTQERWELSQKEKKKPPPLAVQRAAQKTEKFPGASG